MIQSPPPSSSVGPLITNTPGSSMEGIDSCGADGRGRTRDPQGHYGEDCAGDRGKVVGSEGGETPCLGLPDASIYSPGGRGVKGDMKRVE